MVSLSPDPLPLTPLPGTLLSVEPDYLEDPGLDGTRGRILAESGLNRELWDDVRLDILRFSDDQRLENSQDILEQTLNNVPLVAKTELHDEDRRLRAVLEYPVKTMNVLRVPSRFQVDTGPLIVPDFGSTAERQVERFDIAYVVYNRFDGGEFILRKPQAILEGEKPLYSVTDYSEIRVYSGRNQILAGR